MYVCKYLLYTSTTYIHMHAYTYIYINKTFLLNLNLWTLYNITLLSTMCKPITIIFTNISKFNQLSIRLSYEVCKRPLFLKNGKSCIIALAYNGFVYCLNRNASPAGPGAISILILESLSDGIRAATKTIFADSGPDKYNLLIRLWF